MRPPRSARLLPRYMLRKPLKNGTWAYFFNLPTWARKAGCQIRNEPLGADFEAAVARAENVLLPAFDAWRMGGAKDAPPAGAAPGTLEPLAKLQWCDEFSTGMSGTRGVRGVLG
jgi:hypothetical protein